MSKIDVLAKVIQILTGLGVLSFLGILLFLIFNPTPAWRQVEGREAVVPVGKCSEVEEWEKPCNRWVLAKKIIFKKSEGEFVVAPERTNGYTPKWTQDSGVIGFYANIEDGGRTLAVRGGTSCEEDRSQKVLVDIFKCE